MVQQFLTGANATVLVCLLLHITILVCTHWSAFLCGEESQWRTERGVVLTPVECVPGSIFKRNYFSPPRTRDSVADEIMSSCIFRCSKIDDSDIITSGLNRIRTIIASSKQRGDNLHTQLESQLEHNPELTVQCHKSCVSSYTSKQHVTRSAKKRGIHERSTSEPPQRRHRALKFDFKQNCLICGEKCFPRDSRHPDRWKVVIRCRTVERPGKNTFKDALLAKCKERGDNLASDVALRISGARCDLHAADARYHKDCYSRFSIGKNLVGTSNRELYAEPDENESIYVVAAIMRMDESRVWTSVELYDQYIEIHTEHSALSRRQFIRNLVDYLGDDVLEMTIKGCASLIGFRQYIPYNICTLDDDEDANYCLDTIVKQIAAESKEIPRPQDYDLSQFVRNKSIEATSPTLLALVSSLVSKGETTRISLSISQTIQSHITHSYTPTTLGIAVKLHHRFGSREIVSLLHEYGYAASYDEVLRFRSSAAKFVGEQDLTARGLKANSTLISSWCDNYDLHLNTPSGKRETHAMAIEFTQPCYAHESTDDVHHPIIPRLSKTQAAAVKFSELSAVTFEHYHGPKKPLPPPVEPQPKHVINFTQLQASMTEALAADVRWLSSVVSDSDEPECEWAGYMTREARDNPSPGKASKYVFGPLIDSTPSHPDTVLTTLSFIERFVQNHEQQHVIVVADMQLYQVIQHIKWSDPTRWKQLIPRPGGMHTLMSFVSSVGTLMKGSGLEELIGASFGGLASIMNGKAWPRAIRAFRMVATCLLKDVVVSGVTSVEGLGQVMDTVVSHPTGRLWVECFITPVSILMLFIRAEREGNWPLHLYTMERMLPYLFAAGHWQYARYVTWHCLEMRRELPDEVEQLLMDGDHVCRHRDGVWNGVHSDQFGEQTYIRYGKSKGGLVGLTISPEQVARWILSNNICNMVSMAMDSLFDEGDDEYDATLDRHTEEGQRRKELDLNDREKICKELRTNINPLQTETDALVNIYNGCVADDRVNVHNAASIGKHMAAEFRESLPEGFYKTLHKGVVTMETMKRAIQVGGSAAIYDTEKLFGRLLIISQKRELGLSEVFQYELAPLPSSLFDDYGNMRKSAKAVLVKKLGVLTQGRTDTDAYIFDGNEMLYHVSWPKLGHVRQLSANFMKAVQRDETCVYVVFDKYEATSTKNYERSRRAGNKLHPNHKLMLDTELPPRDVVMKNTHNKRQVIKLLCEANTSNTVNLIGQANCKFGHEEADINIIAYLFMLIGMGKMNVQVVADDTDIFLLLVHYCLKWALDTRQIKLSMKKSDGSVIDINASASQLGDTCHDVLAMHALTGSDTTSYPFGKGKLSGLKVLPKVNLKAIGNHNSTLEEVSNAGQTFFSLLYGSKSVVTMGELRYNTFASRRDAPKIKALPPTDGALHQHILRTHLQVMLWKSAQDRDPPDVNLNEFGWEVMNGNVEPKTGVTVMAPPELLKVVACTCSSDKACMRSICSCKAAGLSCTSYCKCQGQDECKNPHTEQTISASDDEEDASDSDT